MPRAALLSLHARVEGARPSTWEDPSLVQLWGPRFSAYVVAARDLAVFSLGRLPDDARDGGRPRTWRLASPRSSTVGGCVGEAGHAPRPRNPNLLRYAAPTGRSSSAGTAHVDRRSGRSRRPTSIRPLLASSSPADTCTSSARRRRRRSRSGPGSRPPRPRRVRRARWLARTPARTPSATPGSWPATSRRSAPRPGRRLAHGCSRAATPTSSCPGPNASSSSPRPTVGPSSGRRGSGPAPSWSTATWSAPGDGPGPW